MKYLVKSATQKGLPYVNKDKKLGIDVMVRTVIEGQSYIGFENIDLVFCEVQKEDTAAQITERINYTARTLVATKYPNT